MSLRVFDTQFVAQGMETIGEIWYCLIPLLTQGMETIGEIWYCLIPLLMQGGPSSALILVASNRVVFFFNGIPKGIPCRSNHKYFIFLYDPFSE
jgi:hypothetical protein